jgi:hypothetical protein
LPIKIASNCLSSSSPDAAKCNPGKESPRLSLDYALLHPGYTLGVNLEGHKELLGMWLSENEGAKLWLWVLIELQNRGVTDILIACVDWLKGFPDAIPWCTRKPKSSFVSYTWCATR